MSRGLTAFIVLTGILLLAGMGYLVYRASRPTVEDALAQVMAVHTNAGPLKEMLSELSTAQRQYRDSTGRYADSIPELYATGLLAPAVSGIRLELVAVIDSTWIASATDGTVLCAASDQTPTTATGYAARCEVSP